MQQLKLFLLHKFRTDSDVEADPRAIPVSPRKARRRSLSPITFAPPSNRKAQPAAASTASEDESPLSDFSGDFDIEDDVNVTKSLADAHRYKYLARPSTSSASDSVCRLHEPPPDSQAYVLISFSTTQILEDRFSLSWYGVRPDELLELHPASVSFANLPRCNLDAYIAPYFAAKVWALRVVGPKIDPARAFTRHRGDAGDAAGEGPAGSREKKRKVAVEWKERWAIIYQGVFSLCKSRHVSAYIHMCIVSNLLKLILSPVGHPLGVLRTSFLPSIHPGQRPYPLSPSRPTRTP